MDTKKTRELQSDRWVLGRMLDMNTVCSQKKMRIILYFSSYPLPLNTDM